MDAYLTRWVGLRLFEFVIEPSNVLFIWEFWSDMPIEMPSPSKIFFGILKVRMSGLIHSSFICISLLLIYSMFFSKHKANCFLYFSLQPGLFVMSKAISDWFSLKAPLTRPLSPSCSNLFPWMSMTLRNLSYLRHFYRFSMKISPR